VSTRVKGMQFDCKLTMQHHVNRVVTGVFIIATSSETTHEKKFCTAARSSIWSLHLFFADSLIPHLQCSVGWSSLIERRSHYSSDRCRMLPL